MIIIGAAVIAVVAAIAAFVALRTSGEESYRSIMVYELEGSAVIERADIGAIDAAENLYLESGDRVRVKEDSLMRLKLDNDKYITAEENTVFVLTAKGSEQDSETRIDLEQGAIINEIQNPLSDHSTYETATPNSVMAVRGTIYRAELCRDEDGNPVTKVYCFEGAVELSAINEGDVYASVIVDAGNKASVNSADLTVSEVTPIDYKSFSPQTLKILNRMNIDTGISEDAEEHDESSVEEPDDAAGLSIADQKDDAENMDNADNAGGEDTTVTQKSNNNTVSASGGHTETGEPAQTKTDISQRDPDSGNADNGDTGSESGDNQPEKEPDKESGDKPNKPKPPKTKEYTVTFQYNGQTFATQKVKAGKKAKEPLLKPAQDGGWDFDFNTEIDKDTEITWK